MIDRGIIKWQPFSSCFNTEEVVKDIKKDREQIKFPTLSEDQLEKLESQIIEAYNLKLAIKITYYYDGIINNVYGKINYLNMNKKNISLNNKVIYLKQILKIDFN